MSSTDARAELSKEIGARQYFSLGFGSIIGIGWIIFLGHWLKDAGPLGAILAFALGGFVVLLVGLCYAELAALLPVSGGEVAYSYEIYGVGVSFATGWAMVLPYTLVTAFEAISVGWVVGALIPGIQGPTLYTVLGYPVQLGSLLLGILGMALFAFINYRGVKMAATAQDVFTYGLICMSLVFILAGIGGGEFDNLDPLFSSQTESIGLGFLTVLFTVPTWLAGFNIIPQLMEEKAPGAALNTVGRVMIVSIILAAVFYGLVILSASMSTPWQNLLKFELPVAGAFEAAFDSPLVAKAVLVAGLFGLLSTWNAVFMAGSRVLFAMGRARIIPVAFGTSHPEFRTPSTAVIFISIVGIIAAFLGRRALEPIINALSTSFAFAFFISCLGVIRLRQMDPQRHSPYRVPGGKATAGVATVACLLMFFISIYLPYESAQGFPVEWGFLIAWAILGIVFWVLGKRFRIQVSESERRRLIFGEGDKA